MNRQIEKDRLNREKKGERERERRVGEKNNEMEIVKIKFYL